MANTVIIMGEEETMDRAKWCKEIPFVAALGVWLLFVPTWSCDRDHDCAARIRRAEERLQKEVDRHGEHSRQAEEKRRELEETKRACGGEPHVH